MKVQLLISRYDRDRNPSSYQTEYTVEVEPEERVLDALLEISTRQDPALAFRKSCAHGVCGSDAMRIDDKERLACKTLFRDLDTGKPIRLEPLRHFPVERDLIVDQSGFLERISKVKPYFIPKEPAEGGEAKQSPEEHALFEETTSCISCGACYSACPVVGENPNFLGPAALVQAARFINDSRDQGLSPRLAELNHKDGVWACDNHFECTRVCPREIKITRFINLLKRQIKTDLSK